MLSLNVLSIDSASICLISDMVKDVRNGTKVVLYFFFWMYMEDCRYVARGEHRVFILFGGALGHPAKIGYDSLLLDPLRCRPGMWSKTPCRSSPISPRAWPSVAFVLLDFPDYCCSGAVVAPSSVLVDVFCSLAAIGVQSCQDFLWHGWDISTLALFVHAAETGAIADQHIC